MSWFRKDNVAAPAPFSSHLPTQLLKSSDYFLRSEERDRRHQTGTSTSRTATVSGMPFSARTAKHSWMAS